ncbi:Pyruvate/Phosphoenolpyruvate kinase-like domain-containing protein [Mycena maculata]|uniref:Pyruvate/Phosphoenolpyruvate kinase-like domain-containing protein n=1 Tax=Mycena maculata TaxID=230809 RepID=A0AAD7HW58_9AGAR|nr:Pyruvate/Phosphoenolpyruvate kinase-like domain-containing protein [Mycena maculata]
MLSYYVKLSTPKLEYCVRALTSSNAHPSVSLKRSYLYVPASSDKMLQKSLSSNSDMIVYDLEDSVPPSAADKTASRARLSAFLRRGDLPPLERVAVRVNDISTPFFQDDISNIVSSASVGSLVLPKVHSADDLHVVSRAIHAASGASSNPLGLIASIESARASWNLGAIAGWRSDFGKLGGTLTALLASHFSQAHCADTSILRSPSRRELLYTRSQIVIAAKAFGLEAIDMVCVNYKDIPYLEDECRDGRQLGFTGKQAIHPAQVDIIQSAFVPTTTEIERAAKIVHKMEREHALNRGATGLDGEMIDRPMILQAEKILQIARAANLKIPNIES